MTTKPASEAPGPPGSFLPRHVDSEGPHQRPSEFSGLQFPLLPPCSSRYLGAWVLETSSLGFKPRPLLLAVQLWE